jgi:hypothetical protein
VNTPQANNSPVTEASPTTSTDNGTGVSYESSYEARAAAVFGNDFDTSSQAADEAPVSSPNAAPPDAAPAASADDVDEATQARRQRLAQLRQQEAASVDAKAQKRQHEELQQRLAAAEKRAEEAERMAALRVDPEALDERGFFEAAAKAKVTPQRLAEYLKQQAENPELLAARAAETALTPKLSEMEKRIAEKEARLDAFLQQQEQAAEAASERAAFQHFAAYTTANAVTSPRSAAFLREFGPEEFQKIATSVAASVPPNAGPQALLDSLEENFARLARVYAGSPAAAKQSIPQHNPGAAQPMTTVSNTLAQQRASVVNEDADWASLPFEERSARVFGR